MKLLSILFASIVLFSSFFPGFKNSASSANTIFNCLVDMGEDIQVQLGESVDVALQTNCPANEIVNISVSPNDNTISCLDNSTPCYEYTIQALSDVCYTFTVESIDGCMATDELCIFLKSCEPLFSENEVAALNPAQVNDLSDVTLEIARTQFVRLEVVNEDEGVQTQVWEGWLKAGERTVSVDFSDIPSGTYNLVGKFYPTEKSISFEKQ